MCRAIGTEPIRNALALKSLHELRTDGTLFIYYLFFYQYFAPNGAIKIIYNELPLNSFTINKLVEFSFITSLKSSLFILNKSILDRP